MSTLQASAHSHTNPTGGQIPLYLCPSWSFISPSKHIARKLRRERKKEGLIWLVCIFRAKTNGHFYLDLFSFQGMFTAVVKIESFFGNLSYGWNLEIMKQHKTCEENISEVNFLTFSSNHNSLLSALPWAPCSQSWHYDSRIGWVKSCGCADDCIGALHEKHLSFQSS